MKVRKCEHHTPCYYLHLLNLNTFSSVLFWKLKSTNWVSCKWIPISLWLFLYTDLTVWVPSAAAGGGCVCLYVLSVVSDHVYAGAYGHTWLSQKRMLGVFLCCLYSTLWDRVSHWTWAHHHLGWRGWPVSSWDPIPNAESYKNELPCQIFIWLVKIWTQTHLSS